MKSVTVNVPRTPSMPPWANRLLRIDLSDMTVRVQESAPYLPQYLGARGLAARLAWEEYPAPVEPFAPANPLMVIPGALTGSRAPYAGRTNICAFSPQASPYPWFSRSSIGKHFGGELKRAGYDGLVVTGAAERPVRILIEDDRVSILPADELWGQDTMDSLEALDSGEGGRVRSLVIGPAGERLSRIATIHTASSSAAGQGGYGGVMGSKKLKAISVAGTGHVPLAHPERVAALARALARLPRGLFYPRPDLAELNQQLAAEGNGRARCEPCTEGCVTPCWSCGRTFEGVPGAVYNRTWSGAWACVALNFTGTGPDDPPPWKERLDFRLSRRAAFEVNVLSNRYGLNQFDLLAMVLWLIACQKAGLISEINGRAMDWNSPEFWDHFLHAIADRQGQGDVLAEGGWAAAHRLHLGEDLADRVYAGWGQCGHWDGHFQPGLPFPYWLVAALQWLADTRDPFNSGHGYILASWGRFGLFDAQTDEQRAAARQQLRALGQRAYGDPQAMDPYSGFLGKAYPAFYHTVRAVTLDCVPVDDLLFPLIYDGAAPDGFRVLRNVEGIGDVEGPAVEHQLFTAGAGLDWPPEEFDRAAQRVCTLERALQVRHWGRDRGLDEMVLPYFERAELEANPLLGERCGLDRAQFAPVLDEFYALHGWDTQRGWPTRERLSDLGLADVYAPMIAGAAEAKSRRG